MLLVVKNNNYKVIYIQLNQLSVLACTGGWWHIQTFDDITGSVAIETGSMTYIEALDTGLFKAGEHRDIGNVVGTGIKHHICTV